MLDRYEIEELAYHIWEREGRPAGRDVAHYYEAERMLRESPSKLEAGQSAHRPRTAARRKAGSRRKG